MQYINKISATVRDYIIVFQLLYAVHCSEALNINFEQTGIPVRENYSAKNFLRLTNSLHGYEHTRIIDILPSQRKLRLAETSLNF